MTSFFYRYTVPISMILAFILDRILGDPPWIPHPIRFIGWIISRLEEKCRVFPGNHLKLAGLFLWGLTLGSVFFIIWCLVFIGNKIHPLVGFFVQTLFMYTAIASQCLEDEGKKVYDLISQGDLQRSRLQISYLVGRDTDELSFQDIARATVETIAENTVDGVLAPIFFGVLGGAPLMMAYKAVNTLDSMVGYKNEKYGEIGFFSAKIDDLWNYIPARISLPLFVGGAILLKFDWKKCWSIAWRDRRNHKSPNSGWPEAAAAGALGIQLGGSSRYFGQLVEKPLIGDKIQEIEPEDIVRCSNLMVVTGILGLFFFAVGSMLFYY